MTQVIYVTADHVGMASGGGSVTANEWEALKTLGDGQLWDRTTIIPHGSSYSDPWGWDDYASALVDGLNVDHHFPVAHFYAGTFSKTVALLKSRGTKVTYTAAAHDVALSKKEHEALGIPYDYPHLTNPDQWQRYLQGYKDADVLIVPSTHSRDVMRAFGCTNRIEVISHGCEIPKEPIKSLPSKFTVGYLGAVGPDKGLRYLLEAWKALNYSDATLVIAGRDSQSDFCRRLCHTFGGGQIELRGWVENVSDFYGSVSLYVQPSVTEGHGMEVLEAMAHGRPVVCSTGAGASDLVPEGWKYVPHDVKELGKKIELVKDMTQIMERKGTFLDRWKSRALPFSWSTVRQRYADVWKGLLV